MDLVGGRRRGQCEAVIIRMNDWMEPGCSLHPHDSYLTAKCAIYLPNLCLFVLYRNTLRLMWQYVPTASHTSYSDTRTHWHRHNYNYCRHCHYHCHHHCHRPTTTTSHLVSEDPAWWANPTQQRVTPRSRTLILTGIVITTTTATTATAITPPPPPCYTLYQKTPAWCANLYQQRITPRTGDSYSVTSS